MRVGLISGKSTVWLAGTPGVSEREHTSVSGFRKSSQIQEQVSNRVRARDARVRDRKNVLTTLTFSTTRLFDSIQKAQLWALDHEATMPREGDLVMEIPRRKGAAIRRYLPNAVVLPPEIIPTGVSVLITYTVRGGTIQTTRTPSL